jgi:hypothetical protein
VTMLVCFFILHARLRAHRAPGIPCALYFCEGGCWQSSGVLTPRECNWLFEHQIGIHRCRPGQASESKRDPGPIRRGFSLGTSVRYVSQPRTSVVMGSCFRRNDSGRSLQLAPGLAMTLSKATSPRLRGEVGEGAKQSLRVRGTTRESEPVESPPSPARQTLATSPRKRGEVKNNCGGLRSLSWARIRATVARNDGATGEIRRCLKNCVGNLVAAHPSRRPPPAGSSG